MFPDLSAFEWLRCLQYRHFVFLMLFPAKDNLVGESDRQT